VPKAAAAAVGSPRPEVVLSTVQEPVVLDYTECMMSEVAEEVVADNSMAK
jgi:hypothetical protein